MSRNTMPKLETKAQEIKVQTAPLPHPDWPSFSTPKSLLHGSRGSSSFYSSLIPLKTYMQCWKSFCYHLPPTDLQHVRQDSKPVSLLSGWTCAFKKPHKELSQDPDQVQMQTLQSQVSVLEGEEGGCSSWQLCHRVLLTWHSPYATQQAARLKAL